MTGGQWGGVASKVCGAYRYGPWQCIFRGESEWGAEGAEFHLGWHAPCLPPVEPPLSCSRLYNCSEVSRSVEVRRPDAV